MSKASRANVTIRSISIHGATFDEVTKKNAPRRARCGSPRCSAKAYRRRPAWARASRVRSRRYTLATLPPTAKRIALRPKRTEGYRFVNKIWNVTKFALQYLKGVEIENAPPKVTGGSTTDGSSRLENAIAISTSFYQLASTTKANEAYRFSGPISRLVPFELTLKTILQAGLRPVPEKFAEETSANAGLTCPGFASAGASAHALCVRSGAWHQGAAPEGSSEVDRPAKHPSKGTMEMRRPEAEIGDS
jgi:hypothetical protein